MQFPSLGGSASLDPDAPPSSLAGEIGVVPDPQVGLPGSIVPLAGVLAQLRPRGGTTQYVGFRVIAYLPTGPVTFDLSKLSDSIEFDEDLGQAVSFTFTVPASGDDWRRGALGYETTWGAPPPGLSRLRLEAYYVIADGSEVVYPLVTDGIAVGSRRSIRRDGHMMTINALGPWARYDKKKATLSLLPRHGRTHGQVASQLALIAGVPGAKVAISPFLGAPRLRAVDVRDEEFRSLVGGIGDSLNHVFDFARDGRFVAFDAAPTGPPEWTFTLADLTAASGMDVDSDGDVPTCVTITGTAPEGPADLAGSVTTFESVDSYAPFSIPGAWLLQQSDGSLGAPGGTPGPVPPATLLVSRVVTSKTKVRGCLHEEQVITYGWYAPEAARYTINSAGDLAAIPLVYLYEPGAVAFDASPAYLWSQHRFVEVSRVITRYFYDETVEELDRVKVYRRGWFNRPAALKHRDSPADPWETEPFINGTKLRGSGAGVVYASELYFAGWEILTGGGAVNPYTLEVAYGRSNDFTTNRNSGGYLIQAVTEKFDWQSPAGGEFLYQSDATPSLYPEFEAGLAGREETTYSAEVSGGLQTVVSSYGANGAFTGQTITKADGYLPAAPRCDVTDEERKSGRPWEVTVCAGEGSHVGRTDEVTNDWIETEAEAREFGADYLRRAQALTLTFEVPVNAALQRGMPVAVYWPEAGIDGEGWIERHAIRKAGRDAPTLSALVVKMRTF